MRKGILFLVFVLLLVTPVSAEIAFGPGAEGVLYSGDGVAELQALFGSALAISPGETLRESALICLEKGGRLYLECRELPSSLAELHLTVCGEAPIFDGRPHGHPGACGFYPVRPQQPEPSGAAGLAKATLEAPGGSATASRHRRPFSPHGCPWRGLLQHGGACSAAAKEGSVCRIRGCPRREESHKQQNCHSDPAPAPAWKSPVWRKGCSLQPAIPEIATPVTSVTGSQ